jgi:hypothetical protein
MWMPSMCNKVMRAPRDVVGADWLPLPPPPTLLGGGRADEGRADRILSPLLAPASDRAAPLPPVPVVPAPTAPQRTSGTTADEIARIRAANQGRIPKEVQKDLGTRISLGDLLGGRR